jgi:RND family efflux transporter MFP subunit
MRNALSIGITVAVGLGALSVTIAQALRANGPARPSPVPVEAAPWSGRVAAEGRVAPYPGSEVRLSAERTGRLTLVRFEEHEKVRRGQLLAEIDPSEIRAEIAEARARIAEAEAEIDLADSNLRRRRALVEGEIATPQDLDRDVRDLEVARARRETARATLARLEAQLRKTRVEAPFDGTITSREVDTGEMVEPGDAIATLADLSRLRVEAEADEADAAAIAVGASVRITSDGYPERGWQGRVEEVADTVTLRKLKPQDPGRPTDTRILSVKVAFEEPTPLRMGTTVELSIETTRSP